MMARMISTIQMKNITMPGMAYPATVLDLVATALQLPAIDRFIYRESNYLRGIVGRRLPF